MTLAAGAGSRGGDRLGHPRPAIDIAVMMGYAHPAAIVARWMKHPRHLAWLNRIIGAWFLVLATLLATGS